MVNAKRVCAAVLVGAATVVLSGCTREAPEPVASETSVSAATQTTPDRSRPAVNGVSTGAAKAALRTAASAVDDGRVFDMETDDRSGEFEAKVASADNEFEVLVDPSGNADTSQRQVSEPSDDIAKLREAQLSADQALDVAVRQLSGDVFFDELEIDRSRDGAIVWQVDLRTPDGARHEFAVDSVTGAVSRR